MPKPFPAGGGASQEVGFGAKFPTNTKVFASDIAFTLATNCAASERIRAIQNRSELSNLRSLAALQIVESTLLFPDPYFGLAAFNNCSQRDGSSIFLLTG
jgi:hypothetical protein